MQECLLWKKIILRANKISLRIFILIQRVISVDKIKGIINQEEVIILLVN
jgi:hypothetical protein